MITAEAQICKSSFLHNVSELDKLCSDDCDMVFVLKANAYGHGAIQLAKLLPTNSILAVARIEEGLTLRDAGVKNPILLLEGCFYFKDLVVASGNNFHISINSQKQLNEFLSFVPELKSPVWLKIDLGMCRLGIDVSEVKFYFDKLNVAEQQIILFSHFSDADNVSDVITDRQLNTFISFKGLYPGKYSIANSAAFLKNRNSHQDFARLGLALYGISPFKNVTASHYNLKPVMRLKSKIISIRDIAENTPVSYGGSWVSPVQTKIAVVALGYADGYPRNVPVDTPVWINGRLAYIVGNVCMDMLMVDLGIGSTDSVGDDVVFWGPELPVEIVASHLKTIPYELVSRISSRVFINIT